MSTKSHRLPAWLHPSAVRMGALVLLVALVTLARFALFPVIGANSPWIFFFPVTLLAGWWIRFRAGVAATLLCAGVGNYFLLLPVNHFNLDLPDLVGTGIFVLVGLLLAALGDHVRQLTLKLVTSEEQFRLIANTAPVLIWRAGETGTCDFFNERWLAFVGRSLKQELSGGWTQNIHPEDLPGCLNIWQTGFETRHDFSMEYRFRRHDGQYRWMRNQGNPRFSADKAFLGFVGSLTDITDLREARDLMQKAKETAETNAERLETAVQERTAKLSEALSELETFSSTVAHDFRAPLRIIISYARMELDDNGPAIPASTAAVLERVISMAHRLNTMMTDLLIYSRVSREELPLGEINLDLLVAEIIKEEDFHKAVFDVRPALGIVHSNAVALRQALFNLVGNAAKFVDEGTVPRIRITSEEKDGRLVLSVHDNGVGFDEHDRQNLFRLFYRGHRVKSYPGTGLGLGTAQKAIQRVGGTLALAESTRQGSCFCISLPLARR